MGRFVNVAEGFIDYRLNILGIRVNDATCQLIARQGEEWQALGAPRPLPVTVPSLARAAAGGFDELHLTACQFLTEYPQSDLAAVLSRSANFLDALKAS